MSIAMPFDEASSGGKRYGARQRHPFLPAAAAFRKVKKIRKELKGNGSSNTAGFLKRS